MWIVLATKNEVLWCQHKLKFMDSKHKIFYKESRSLKDAKLYYLEYFIRIKLK